MICTQGGNYADVDEAWQSVGFGYAPGNSSIGLSHSSSGLRPRRQYWCEDAAELVIVGDFLAIDFLAEDWGGESSWVPASVFMLVMPAARLF